MAELVKLCEEHSLVLLADEAYQKNLHLAADHPFTSFKVLRELQPPVPRPTATGAGGSPTSLVYQLVSVDMSAGPYEGINASGIREPILQTSTRPLSLPPSGASVLRPCLRDAKSARGPMSSSPRKLIWAWTPTASATLGHNSPSGRLRHLDSGVPGSATRAIQSSWCAVHAVPAPVDRSRPSGGPHALYSAVSGASGQRAELHGSCAAKVLNADSAAYNIPAPSGMLSRSPGIRAPTF
ncbi:Alanine aminotransferase [Mycena kentingensis (nom. inval.)]|nr:Alanine aminotransferase [Mycena kentingensis (nom. inval.)]